MSRKELVEKWEALRSEIDELNAKISELKEKQSEICVKLEETLTPDEKQFQMNGLWYQPRRKRGAPFLCKSEKKFGSWKRKVKDNE